MLIPNTHPSRRAPLDPRDVATLDRAAAAEVARYLAQRGDHRPTPLHALGALARGLDVASIHLKDEGQRLGLGSFKALGGSYAVIRLVLEEAGRDLGRAVGFDEMRSPEVRRVAGRTTVACATDGNHGRAVASGAALIGARCVVFVHAGVSAARRDAIARLGADVIAVDGTYDDSVAEAWRVCGERGWTAVSDTSWPGYERIPGLVMQGYTALAREVVEALTRPPTHVFLQAGVGGLAAAIAGHLALAYGDQRPAFVVVEPERAACLFESARAGHLVKVAPGAPTVMAMLECYEPSAVAWRILSRAADAFMTVEEDDAIAVMNRLARPAGEDPAVVSGESGGVGLAGLIRLSGDAPARALVGLRADARVLVVNTEGATDPDRYRQLVGLDPATVGRARP